MDWERFRLSNKLTSKILFLLSFLGILSFLNTSAQANSLKVVRVIDGDTILISTGETVRLIGVDTPETKHPQKAVERFGKEAYHFTKKMVEGKEVRLEFDQRKRDKYGRLLAYVYLMDGTFVNAEIIRQGYGFAYKKHPYKYLEEFRRLEREAREQKRGLWN
ncbi:MAG: thermonuclease family protein [Desulfobacterota bacterium]|nr:thermonuclease family protein [Thermodesulfobacteriota bacterium]